LVYFQFSVYIGEIKTPRTVGELFYAGCDEIPYITLREAPTLLLELLKSTVKQVLLLSEEKLKSYSLIL